MANSRAGEPLLFTPGPLTTSRTVREAMLRDWGSRDTAFIQIIREVRERLTQLAGAPPAEYTAVPMQGSGTFALEAAAGSLIPRNGKLLSLINGAYGRRLAHICETLGIQTARLEWPEDQPIEPATVCGALERDSAVTHVAACHCETTTGILNPIEEIGAVVRGAGRQFIVDAMSSFGAIPLNVAQAGVDYLISSSNKCIEGAPGFAFVIARLDALLATRGYARSVSLDLLAQYEGLERDGQFRFTPPTHVIAAFRQALGELEAEGGVEGRARRYAANHKTLMAGMAALGFEPYLKSEHRSYIITSFRYPRHPRFDFEIFYKGLSAKGFLIYPGKTSAADCFRIGTIGRLFPEDIRALLDAIAQTLAEMQIELTPAPIEV